MLSRFDATTEDGKRRLENALREQRVVAHDQEIAKKLLDSLTVLSHNAGEVVMRQDDKDTDIGLILAGVVTVEINGREVATRKVGEHIGEMAMIDPSATRSATIRARTETVVARIPEPRFTAIADRNPAMWRRLAVDLGRRLRERGGQVRPMRDRPVVFVGSTAERLAFARAIQGAFQYDPWVTTVWTDGVFGAGKTPIESLMAQLEEVDFGLLMVSADDVVETRGTESPSPRDNIIFELGLLTGALGRDRTFMVRNREDTNLKLPSDLVGVKALEIAPGDAAHLSARVGAAMEEFRTTVKRLGPR